MFPNIRRPKILWMGIGGDIDILKAIQKKLNKNLSKTGFKIDKRPFKGHLTIGRIKGRTAPGLFNDLLAEYNDFETDSFICQEVILFKSDLRQSGPVYTRLFSGAL